MIAALYTTNRLPSPLPVHRTTLLLRSAASDAASYVPPRLILPPAF